MPRRSRFLSGPADRPRRSLLVRILRKILIAVFIAFVIGFVIGIFLRRELDRPVRYMGERPAETAPTPADPCTLVDSAKAQISRTSESIGATDPRDVRYALARVFMARHDKKQIG
jgi:hypothetical protein